MRWQCFGGELTEGAEVPDLRNGDEMKRLAATAW
jgi:hypothetical protein